MARYKELKSDKQPRLWIVLDLFLTIPWLLIKIGDIVIFIVKLPFLIIFKTYNIIRSIPSFLFQALQKRMHKRGRGRPRKKKPFIIQMPRLRIPHVPIPRIQLPTFSLPSLKIPTITLPTFSFPSIRIPTIRLPKIQFPTPTKPALPTASVVFVRKKRSRKHLVLSKLQSFLAGIAVSVFLILIPTLTYNWLKELPNPKLLSHRDLEVTTKIFDRNGSLLYEIYADQNRTPLSLEQIPTHVKDATIAIEDKDFYYHQGFSIPGILRAARETILNKDVQGGSTITQQLIKSALLTPEVKLTRKIKEIILAFWAERLYSKNEILEMYLNQVPYGGTAWGVEAASQTYFGKSVSDLNLAEAALLAGLPQTPTEYSPFGSHPQKAFVRQREVLRRMREDHYITPEQEKEALETPIQFAQQHIAIRAPHFVMYVKELLEQRYGPRVVERGGLRITTSLDMSIQQDAEEILRTKVNELASLRVGNGAALITNPKTGEILAMVGSKDYFDSAAQGNVNVTTSLRQPGSSIKVVTYAAALENGFTAASILDDSPIVYQIPGSTPYAPVNYDGKFHGPTPFRYALANSYNIPAVKTLAKIGIRTMIDKGRLMGIRSWTDESRFGLSLTLGGGEVTMLDMAQVFGTLANSGRHVDLTPILEVTDYTGRVLEKNTQKGGTAALKPETAWIMSNILADNTARMAAFGPSSSLVVRDRTVSVKTGTTDNKRDNWTIGYTPSYVVTVWVGNNDNSPMDPFLTSGITGAAPIWHDIMEGLLKNKPNEVFPKPDSVAAIPCYFGRMEYFIEGTQPTTGRCGNLPTPTPTGSPTPNP